MKTKLLKKLRRRGRNQISIYSVTTQDGCTTGMKIGYSDDKYSGLFEFGDTKEEVLRKAEHIFITEYLVLKKVYFTQKKK